MELARLRERPDDFLRLAWRNVRHVGLVVLHAGNFFISSPCAFSSARLPSTISCMTLPPFFATKRMVSPLTRTSDGLKRMASLMSTVTVRDAFFGSPCRAEGVLLGRDGLRCAGPSGP